MSGKHIQLLIIVFLTIYSVNSQAYLAWTITSFFGTRTNIPVNITTSAFIVKHCNTQQFPYRISSGNRISIQAGFSTLMACATPVTPSQESLRNALTSVVSYQQDGNTLNLKNRGGQTFIVLTRDFSSRPPTGPSTPTPGPAPSSINGSYSIVNVNNFGSTSLNNVYVSISNNTISYQYCNRKNLSYTLQGNTINIQRGISTLMACDDLTPSENEVDTAFADARTFEHTGTTLRLIGADGRTKVTLARN